MSIRDCSRCIATKKSGGQCTRRTCKYPALCWQHTKYEKGLVIRPSRIVGADSGLYADKDFKRNQKITEYTGDEKSLDDYNDDDSGYGFQYRTGRIIDARSTQSALGRYINDCRPEIGREKNVRVTILSGLFPVEVEGLMSPLKQKRMLRKAMNYMSVMVVVIGNKEFNNSTFFF